MADRRLIDEWLTKAEEDFAFAKVNTEQIRNWVTRRLA
jgi:hypothetical protein